MNCSQHLGEFVTVRPTLPSCCKAELVELNQKLLGMAGCLKLSIYLHPLIHFSVLGQGLEPIPAVIQQDAEYTLHRSPTPIYCK